MRRISLPFSFTQDYRAASEIPPPLYTETFSIGKIDIENNKRLLIRSILIQNYVFKSTQALTNPVTLALVLSDNLEAQLRDGFTKLVDRGKGLFLPIDTVPPNAEFPGIDAPDKIQRLQTIVCYEDVLEYDTYIDENNFSDPNYDFASASKLLVNNPSVDTYLLNGTTYSVNDEIEIDNPQGKSYLYIFPFTAKIQRTRVATAGRINLSLDYLPEED